MPNSDDAPHDNAPVRREQIGGDHVGGDKVGGDKIGRDKLTMGDISGSGVAIGAGASATVHHHYYPPVAPPLDRQQQRNREAMLKKVRTIWIDGLLSQSLANELRIALDLTEQPDAVVLPLNALVQELRRPPRPLPPGTPIIGVFEQMNGALLILGAPGAGKTTLLLELARDLITRAEHDQAHPIPVVFNLSSWAEQRGPLVEWLAEELHTKYDVPRKVAQAWIAADEVLPLLDGLDEVAAERRGECVTAINTYREEHGLVPLAICSRIADYEALSSKLRLQSAVIIQTLTQWQVEAYFEQTGERLTEVRAALCDDAELRAMLDTPLMLSIVTLAYKDKSVEALQVGGTENEHRQRLFAAYVAAMFQRRGEKARFSQQQTLHWLSSLAREMQRQAQTVFLVERLQPQWLPSQKAKVHYALLDRCSGGLVFGLVFGLVSGLAYGLVEGLVEGLLFGLFFGLAGGMVAGAVLLFFGGQTGIEMLHRRRIGHMIIDALIGVLVGVLIGILFIGTTTGLSFALTLGLTDWLLNGLFSGLFSGLVDGLLFGLAFGLSIGLSIGLLSGLLGVLTGKPSISPRQIIVVERLHWTWDKGWKSAVSGALIGVSFGLIGRLPSMLQFRLVGIPANRLEVGLVNEAINELARGLISGLFAGLAFGLISGLVGGLDTRPLTAITRVNQGIRRSAHSALITGLVFGLVGGLVRGLLSGLLSGLLFGLVAGLGSALAFGGYTCISHFALRIILSCYGSLPLRLIPFLDSCAERILLRKVGGGYIFVHRLLMEHFAVQVPKTESTFPNTLSTSQIISGPPHGKAQTWVCSACSGFVRQNATMCKHCKSRF